MIDLTDILFSKLEQKLLTHDQLAPIVNGFLNEFKLDLKTPSKGLATMIPSFVTQLPTGSETGTFLSLDLGGTNFRISAVQLLGNGKGKMLEVKYALNKELKTGPGDIFFDWMANSVDELVRVKGRHLFKDLATMFHDAFKRKGLNVKVSAIQNDTVGTLVAHAYSNPRSRIGLIFATGVNAAYPEKVENIIKLDMETRLKYAPGTECFSTLKSIFLVPKNSYL